MLMCSTLRLSKRGDQNNENAEFILEDGKYICGWAVEKMSKSMFNVVNPDDIVAQYGADTLRLYEMFLGPVEATSLGTPTVSTVVSAS